MPNTSPTPRYALFPQVTTSDEKSPPVRRYALARVHAAPSAERYAYLKRGHD